MNSTTKATITMNARSHPKKQPDPAGLPPSPSSGTAQERIDTHAVLARSLTDLACDVGNRMQCDVCSIYRLDRQCRTLILAATVGLRQDCVDKLQMNVAEGLCGLVVQQRRPVSVGEKASTHPRFKFFPESGEDPYETFLGVPIFNEAEVVGVLVVQTMEPHRFTSAEEKSLAQSGREIGPLVERLRRAKEAE